ncbi:hypothetical protein FACS1894180_1860 [Bacteroidia bacterium]|nr:hypothetical protein FACS1894180_1860 [Bacteroidia bacterium]
MAGSDKRRILTFCTADKNLATDMLTVKSAYQWLNFIRKRLKPIKIQLSQVNKFAQ